MKVSKLLIALVFPVILSGQLQSSGPISIGDIRAETGNNSGALSVQRNVAGLPGGTVSMSDFYGYSGGTSYVEMTGVLRGTTNVCANHVSPLGGVYGTSSDFLNTSGFYTNTSGTPYAAGWFSKDGVRKYWNGSAITTTEFCN